MNAEQLYEIYEKFTEQLVEHGWNGRFYGWKETVTSGWDKDADITLFEYGNGFCLELLEPRDGEPSLAFQFGEVEEEVNSIEELMAIFSLG